MRGWIPAAVVVLGVVVLLTIGARTLLRGRRVPTRAKLAIAGAIAWLLSPIDVIPDLAPVVGILDDVVVLIAAVRYVLDQVQPGSAGPTGPVVEDRLRGRRPLDASDWRLADDPPDRT